MCAKISSSLTIGWTTANAVQRPKRSGNWHEPSVYSDILLVWWKLSGISGNVAWKCRNLSNSQSGCMKMTGKWVCIMSYSLRWSITSGNPVLMCSVASHLRTLCSTESCWPQHKHEPSFSGTKVDFWCSSILEPAISRRIIFLSWLAKLSRSLKVKKRLIGGPFCWPFLVYATVVIFCNHANSVAWRIISNEASKICKVIYASTCM